MKIAIIGKGNVGSALAPHFARVGHDVVFAVRDPADPKYAGGDIAVESVPDAVASADIVVLAVHWGAIDAVLAEAGSLDGKIVVDCVNALDFANGLAWIIPADTSAAQILASRCAGQVVKAFNQVGAEAMAKVDSFTPPMLQFAASDHPEAKQTVIGLMREIGFDARDAGGLDAARDLESMARLWIAQAFSGMPGTTGWVLAAPDA